MSTKKPAVKTKEKTAKPVAIAAKRKPVSEAKEATQTMDARSSKDRRQDERRQKSVPVPSERRVTERRAKVNRRRQIDPTTCERDYSPAEVEFMNALDDYKRRSGRMFPTCSEILEVFLALGYEKRAQLSVVASQEPATVPPETANTVQTSLA